MSHFHEIHKMPIVDFERKIQNIQAEYNDTGMLRAGFSYTKEDLEDIREKQGDRALVTLFGYNPFLELTL